MLYKEAIIIFAQCLYKTQGNGKLYIMKKAYNILSTLITIFATGLILNAQTSGIRFEMANEIGVAKNGETITISGTTEGVELFMNVVNISGAPIELKWERVRISVSSSSINDQLCDNWQCYDPSFAGDYWMLGGTINLATGGQTVFQPKMITPQGQGGNATFMYYVRNDQNERIDSITVVFTSTASIKNEIGVSNAKVYPNPSNGQINVKDAPAGSEIEVTDMVGKVVFKTKLSGTNQSFDLSKNPDGVYFYTIRSADGQSTITKRLVIRK